MYHFVADNGFGGMSIIPHPHGWLLGFYDSTRDKDDTTVGVGHSRRYCNTGYDQSQGRRPSTLKCIGSISKGDIEPNHPSEINPNSDSSSRSDGRSRRFVQYRVDQSQGQRPRSLHSPSLHFTPHPQPIENRISEKLLKHPGVQLGYNVLKGCRIFIYFVGPMQKRMLNN